MSSDASPAERVRDREDRVSANECRAMRLLARDGWTSGELRMTMLVGTEAVCDHVTGRCTHAHDEPTVEPGWSRGGGRDE